MCIVHDNSMSYSSLTTMSPTHNNLAQLKPDYHPIISAAIWILGGIGVVCAPFLNLASIPILNDTCFGLLIVSVLALGIGAVSLTSVSILGLILGTVMNRASSSNACMLMCYFATLLGLISVAVYIFSFSFLGLAMDFARTYPESMGFYEAL